MKNGIRWKSRKLKIHWTMTVLLTAVDIAGRCSGLNWKPVCIDCLFVTEIASLSFSLSLSLILCPSFFEVVDYHSDTVRIIQHSEKKRIGSAKEHTKLSVDMNRSTGNLFTATRSQISSIDTGYWLWSHTGQFCLI